MPIKASDAIVGEPLKSQPVTFYFAGSSTDMTRKPADSLLQAMTRIRQP